MYTRTYARNVGHSKPATGKLGHGAGHIYSNTHDPSFTANLFKARWTRWPRCRRPNARGLVLHTARGMQLVGIKNTTRGVQCSAK